MSLALLSGYGTDSEDEDEKEKEKKCKGTMEPVQVELWKVDLLLR